MVSVTSFELSLKPNGQMVKFINRPESNQKKRIPFMLSCFNETNDYGAIIDERCVFIKKKTFRYIIIITLSQPDQRCVS